MTEFYKVVVGILKEDTRFVSENGEILRNAVYEAAMKMDSSLIKSLYDNEITRARFFTDIDGIAVFDKVGFGWVINNRNFLPDSYTRYKNKIGLVDRNGNFISASNDIELVFPYKDCVLEGGQTKEYQKRIEIFYNETLAHEEVDRLLFPKVFSSARRFSANGTEYNITFGEKDNLIIKGNNLLVIASLLKKYEGKIKCIYIDPPYNPESDANTFCYNNTFNRSSWLVFMKNRLEIAKKLLSIDGVMIVAIDKNEQPRLQILIEEIFVDYDTDCITVVHNPRGAIGTNFSYTHEFAIFVTPKGKKTIANRELSEDEIDWSTLRNWGGESLRTDARNCFYPIIVENDTIVGFGDVCPDDFHPSHQTECIDGKYYVYPIDGKGIERKWRYARQTVETIINMLRVKKTKTGYDIELGKTFGTYRTVWIDPKYDASVYGTQLLKSILPDTTFTYPKSLYTVIDCISAVVKDDKNAIVLDFFGGSGTTGHAVMEINKDGGKRRFILVEQMDYVETDTLQRNVTILKSIAPDDSIVYCELAKLNQNFVDAILGATSDEQLKKLHETILASSFISYKVKPSDLFEETDFDKLGFEDKQKILMELLDKNHLYINYCDIDDESYAVSEADKAFTKSFYEEK